MKFEIDNQTLSDLQIFSSSKNQRSVSELFFHTKSYGGKIRLREIMKNPLTDFEKIIQRKEFIQFLERNSDKFDLSVDKNDLDFIEHYLNQENKPTKVSIIRAIERGLAYKIKEDNSYFIIQRGIYYLLLLIDEISSLAGELKKSEMSDLLQYYIKNIDSIFEIEEFRNILSRNRKKRISSIEIEKYDYLFRYQHRDKICFLLNFIYELDALMSVGITVKKYDFTYPYFIDDNIDGKTKVDIKGLFHPLIPDSVKNDISFDEEKNLAFITGPNMAGKSTFLRALGIAVYLAHLGFPIPASSMKINLLTGIVSAINMADNQNLGYSHFYSEVLRVKKVTDLLDEGHRLLVIFDELFKGTNLKDAQEASISIISGFAAIRSSIFLISSHIIEVAYHIPIDGIRKCYFEITDKQGIPCYTYTLKDGISEDRIGMYIIEKEGIIKKLTQLKTKENEFI